MSQCAHARDEAHVRAPGGSRTYAVWLKLNYYGASWPFLLDCCHVTRQKVMFQAMRGQQPIRFSIQPALPPGMSLDTTTGNHCPPHPTRIPCVITRCS